MGLATFQIVYQQRSGHELGSQTSTGIPWMFLVHIKLTILRSEHCMLHLNPASRKSVRNPGKFRFKRRYWMPLAPIRDKYDHFTIKSEWHEQVPRTLRCIRTWITAALKSVKATRPAPDEQSHCREKYAQVVRCKKYHLKGISGAPHLVKII